MNQFDCLNLADVVVFFSSVENNSNESIVRNITNALANVVDQCNHDRNDAERIRDGIKSRIADAMLFPCSSARSASSEESARKIAFDDAVVKAVEFIRLALFAARNTHDRIVGVNVGVTNAHEAY